jgi:hypothetical protein
MQIALTPNTVYTFKLTSGEELIAKVIQSGADFLQIEEPVSIAPGPQGLGFMPSVFTANPKGDFRLNTSTITVYAETDDDIKMKYLEATTGIKVPEKKILVG